MDVKTATHNVPFEIVSLSGRLDALEAVGLREMFASYELAGSHHLIVDLSGVVFVDSPGLAALVKAMKDARRAGGDVRLVRSTHADASRVFELTKFDQVFVLGDDVDELVTGW